MSMLAIMLRMKHCSSSLLGPPQGHYSVICVCAVLVQPVYRQRALSSTVAQPTNVDVLVYGSLTPLCSALDTFIICSSAFMIIFMHTALLQDFPHSSVFTDILCST